MEPTVETIMETTIETRIEAIDTIKRTSTDKLYSSSLIGAFVSPHKFFLWYYCPLHKPLQFIRTTMSSILTSRQTLELHKAVLQYLEPLLEDNQPTFKNLASVLHVENEDSPVPNYLEKKWSTVLRLQKRILDLENEINSYKALLDSLALALGVVLAKDKINWLPNSVTKKFPTQSSQIVSSVSLHPSLPLVVAGCSDGTLISWSLASDDTQIPQKQWNGHSRGINKIRWSLEPVDVTNSKNKLYVLALCSSDLSIKIWEGDSFKHVRTLMGHEHTVSGVAFSPTNPTVLYSVSRDKAVKIWDIVNGFCMKTFVGHSDWVRDLDVALVNSSMLLSELKQSNLGDFIVTCSNDQSVRLSHESGTGLALLLGHSHVIESVRFLPMYSNAYLDKVILLNMNRFPQLLEAMINDPIYSNSLGFKYCVSGGRDNLIKLWLLPPPTLRPHRTPTPSVQNNSQGWHIADLVGHLSWVKTLDVHPNGRFIISGSDDKSIKIWDLEALAESGKTSCVKLLSGHEGFINSIHFARFEFETSRGKENTKEILMAAIERSMRCLFVSGGTDNTVRLWG